MSNNYLNLDYAMNMIKENLLRDLSESVIETRKNRSSVLKGNSFSEKYKDYN